MFTEDINKWTEEIGRNPQNAEAYKNRADAYTHMHDKPYIAIADYSKAIELKPDFGEAYRNRGITYFEIKNYDKAIADYNKVMKLNPKDDIYYARGRAYFEMKNYDQAVDDFSKVIEYHGYADAYYSRACAYYEKGEYTKSIEDFDSVVVLCTNDTYTLPASWIGKGKALLKQEKIKDAVDCFVKSEKDILWIITLFLDKENKNAILANSNSMNTALKMLLEHDDFFKEITKTILGKDLERYKDVYIHATWIVSLLYVTYKEHKIAHYTTKDTLLKLFSDRTTKFRLFAITHSNDPTEGISLLDYLFGKQQKDAVRSEEYCAFAGSFSFNLDNLTMFRLYGKENGQEGSGVSMIVREVFFSGNPIHSYNKNQKELYDNYFPLFRCMYINPETGFVASIGHREEHSFYENGNEDIAKEQSADYKEDIDKILFEIRKGIKDLKAKVTDLNSEVISQLLLTLRYLTKHIAFKEEQECRIIKIERLSDNKNVHTSENHRQLYLEYQNVLPYRSEIIFGPKAVDMELYRDILKSKGKGVETPCIRSKHPLA